MRATKKRFLLIWGVCGLDVAGVQAAILIGDESDLSLRGPGVVWFLRGVRNQTRAFEGKGTERVGGALGDWASAGDQREVTRDVEVDDFDDLESAEFEFLRDGPAGDEADA